MGVETASLPTIPPSACTSNAARAEETGDLQELVLATCLARNEFLEQRTGDKVRDIQKRNTAIRKAREALLEIKNCKRDGGFLLSLSEETVEYLMSHSEVLPEGADAGMWKLVNKFLDLEEKSKRAELTPREAIEYQQLKKTTNSNMLINALKIVASRARDAGNVVSCSLSHSADFAEFSDKFDLLIKRETAEAQATCISLQATINAGEQMITLAKNMVEKHEDVYRKLMRSDAG